MIAGGRFSESDARCRDCQHGTDGDDFTNEKHGGTSPGKLSGIFAA
jgi:hypothetical protein